MTQKPVIVVLEDMRVRIAWLKGVVDDVATIRWAQSVADMITILGEYKPEDVALLIFDHDIPPSSDDDEALDLMVCGHLKDVNGQDGSDAAKLIPETFATVPAIIWSVNPNGAQNIQHTLQKRGWITATHRPFLTSNHRALAVMIELHLERWGARQRVA